MRLQPECIRVPVTFDAARLAAEIAQFAASDWRPVIPLVSGGGDPTPAFSLCPYVQEVLASLRSPVGRTRLVRFVDDSAHVDSSYYAAHRARVHVPVGPGLSTMVFSGGASVQMAPGEAWILDPSKPH